MEQRSPEWHEARKGRITASIVGAILGLSPYMSRHDAMRTLVRAREGAPAEFTGNVATEYGQGHEDGARIEYEMEYSATVKQVGFVPYEDWAGVSPDGLIGERGLLEIKCPYSMRHEPSPVPFKTIEEQPHYLAQIQFQLFVTGREWCDFFQWSPNGTSKERVWLDPQWVRDNIPRLRQFHAEFLAEPADDHLAPARKEIDTPEAARMMEEWDRLSEQADNIAARKKDLLDELVTLAGGSNALINGRKLTLTKRDGAISYKKALDALAPGADLSPYKGKPSNFWQVR